MRLVKQFSAHLRSIDCIFIFTNVKCNFKKPLSFSFCISSLPSYYFFLQTVLILQFHFSFELYTKQINQILLNFFLLKKNNRALEIKYVIIMTAKLDYNNNIKNRRFIWIAMRTFKVQVKMYYVHLIISNKYN